MRAEVIFTGTELLLGEIVNTNAQLIGRRMAEWGINLYYLTTVGDNRVRLVECIKNGVRRSDAIFLVGGLGPTEDDLTRESLAEALELELRIDPAALQQVEHFFTVRGRQMPPENIKQAMMPTGANMIPNPIGTAPGLCLTHGGCLFIALPGPPNEFELMLEEQVSRIVATRGEGTIISHTLKVCGIGESHLCQLISDLMQGANPTLAPTAKIGEIHLRITAKSPNRNTALAMIGDLEKRVMERVGRYVFGCNAETLEGVVGNLLSVQGKTLAVAESCTGGLLAHRLTNVPGSSAYLQLAVVAYHNRWKKELLGVQEENLTTYGAVSAEVARDMAEGIRDKAGCDIGIGITGIAGPGGGSDEKPVGLVHYGIAGRNWYLGRHEVFWGSREEIKYRATQAVLALLWQKLREN